MQAHDPKGEQVPPPNYEQLLSHPEHQQRQKYMCVYGRHADLLHQSMRLLPKADHYKVGGNNQGLTLPKHRKESGLFCHWCFSSPIIDSLPFSTSSSKSYV
jgi:hypothetical protein